jgi:hypothetical protein
VVVVLVVGSMLVVVVGAKVVEVVGWVVDVVVVDELEVVVAVVLVVGGRVGPGRLELVDEGCVVGTEGGEVGVVPGPGVVGGPVSVGVDVVVEVDVVVGGGRVGNPPPEPGTVVATGPKTMVVVVVSSSREMAGTPPGLEVTDPPPDDPAPSLMPPANTSGASAGSLPRIQLTPAKTLTTSTPAESKTMVPEMRRPTKTLSRNETRVWAGRSSARRRAICLARSSGPGLCRPLG